MSQTQNLLELLKHEENPTKRSEILRRLESALDKEIDSFESIQNTLVQMSVDLIQQRDTEYQNYLRPIRF